MKRRWFIYIIIGLLFGVFDFYYQEITQGGGISSFVTVMAWLIWLIPVIPIILYEAKVSKSRMMSALANVLTWSTSTISYYLFMAIKLIFIGQATRQELHISNYRNQFYWSNLKSLFLGDILGSIVEWIGIAVIGGFIIGYLISFIYLHIKENCNARID